MKNGFKIQIWNNYHSKNQEILMRWQIDSGRNIDQNEFRGIHSCSFRFKYCLKQQKSLKSKNQYKLVKL
jgi:hypothetical protein